MSFDSEGTFHVPMLTIPQSQLVSPQFRDAYQRRVASMLGFPRPPAIDAPKAQWDRFDADVDRFLAPTLAWNLDHYPVELTESTLGGVRVGIITPRGGVPAANRNRVLINLHGGGFFTGRGLVKGQTESIPVASLGGFKIVTVDYRQAPYHRFPAASEDVESVYRALLKEYKPEAIGIFGCSAGGTLTAQVVARFQARRVPRPGAIGILCAAPVPFGRRGDSSMWSVTGVPLGPKIGIARASGAPVTAPEGYMEGTDVTDATAYPGSSDNVLAKFPATLLVSGTRSEEMSGVIVSHARLLRLGVDSYLYLMESGWHGAAVSAEGTPEGRDVSVYISRWFGAHLAQ